MDNKILELRYALMQQALQLAKEEEDLSEKNIIKKFKFLLQLLDGSLDKCGNDNEVKTKA